MRIRPTDCDRWREAIRARVGEGVAGEQISGIQSHLDTCPDCRRYAQELRAATAGLRWLGSREVEPSPGFRARWTRAVDEAARPGSVGESVTVLVTGWRGWLRRNLRPALGVASLWILALVFRLSAPAVAPSTHATAAHSPLEIARALGADQSLLAWQHWKRDLLPAPPRQPHTPQPRSERFPAQRTGQLDPEQQMLATTTAMCAIIIAQGDSAVLTII
jgi:hypothetical protein